MEGFVLRKLKNPQTIVNIQITNSLNVTGDEGDLNSRVSHTVVLCINKMTTSTWPHKSPPVINTFYSIVVQV